MLKFHFSFYRQTTEQIQHLTVSSTTNPNSTAAATSVAANVSAVTAAQNSSTPATNASGTTTPTTASSTSIPTSAISPAISNSTISTKNLLKDSTITISGGKPQNLSQRIRFLQTQLAHAPMPSITSKRRSLPSIEEAWNLPISAEMSSRQQQQSAQAQTQQQRAFAKGGYTQVSRSTNLTLSVIVILFKFKNIISFAKFC